MSIKFAIIRVQKIKTFGALKIRANHNLRAHPDAAKNADPARKDDNVILRGSNDPTTDVQERFESLGIKPRKNAVVANEILLAASPEFFDQASLGSKKFNAWVQDNLKFLDEQFGKENIVSAVLHLDEATPHIQVLMTPIHTKNKNKKPALAAKKFFDRPLLRKLHDDYAASMKRFGLERGIKNSKVVHQSAQEFRREAELELKEIQREQKKAAKLAQELHQEKTSLVSSRSFVDSLKARYKTFIDKLRSQIKRLKRTNKRLENENERLRRQLAAAVELQKQGIDIIDAAEATAEARAERERLILDQQNFRNNNELLIDKSVYEAVAEVTEEKDAKIAELELHNEQLQAALKRSGKTLDIK